ncbi:MSMEG_0569 family flavin-dependent oxidoreductase [Serratia sp. M24T3]|uniref:MSMEG_0569 family flavin-dependent oxidoreductase n=1 Tax=Serratia sp. M24T3 TaxID=932213 RepID=UPI00025BA29F|nr:MSMEG_0569 family flavin-dependent oxidoreductase [Serratia sp. M24T3]EIC86123.1 FAD-dependent pyridine nucleotide-disulfide oxidoreductase [Serratia sp. M24T3]
MKDNQIPTAAKQSQHVHTLIIGGGQAGLSMSYVLKQQGVEHLILERHRLGWAWREQRWDTFCLVTPNWQCRLPGFHYAGKDPEGFMVKSQIVDYLESYAAHFSPPIREGVNVIGISRSNPSSQNGRFCVTTSEGEFTAEQVVVAVGNYHRERFPAISSQLPARITQLHSAQYRNAESLPEGEVLVVGSAQSGAQIAEDLHLAGRKVHLCVGNAPRVARFYRGRDVVAWLDDMGHYQLNVDNHPLGEDARQKTNHYVTGRDGGRDIDLRAFARQGMQLHGRMQSYQAEENGDGWLVMDDGLTKYLDAADATSEKIKDSIDAWIAEQGISAPIEARYVPVWQPSESDNRLDLSKISAIVWAVGFHTDFSWIDVPAFNHRGYPIHRRGVCDIAGLYFLGLPWLWTWGSGRFEGVGQDAIYLGEQMLAAGFFGQVAAMGGMENAFR